MTIKNVLYVEGCRDGTVGGSHISLFSLIKNLDRKRFNPIVIFYNNHYIADKLRRLNIDVHILKNSSPLDIGLLLSQSLPALKKFSPLFNPLQKIVNFTWFFLRPSFHYVRFLNENSIDLVHLNNSINTNHEWMLAAKLTRVKLISHERGVSDKLSRSAKLLGNSTDLLICISNKIRETLLKQGVNENKTVVVYNGIDFLLIRPQEKPEHLKSAYGISMNNPVIGVVGNIKQWKGQEIVVRATAILKETWPDIKCLLVGGVNIEDPYKHKLENIMRELKIEKNVIFTGFQENPADFLNIMDVVVHSSIQPEPFGRVNIEGMYLKKPVISVNIGGPMEIFEDGKNGILIEPGNPIILAEKITLLLKNPELRQELGQNAYRTVLERFSISDTVRQIEHLYGMLIRNTMW